MAARAPDHERSRFLILAAFLGVALGLVFVQPVRASQARAQATYLERVLVGAAQPDDVAREQIFELMAEVEGREDDDGRLARYLAELTIALRLEPSDDARGLVLETLAGFPATEAEMLAVVTAELAQQHVLGGHLDEAEGIAAFGLEHLDLATAWSQEPRLWYVRAKVARALGRWTEAEQHLAEMEGAIKPDGAPELTSDALKRQNHMYRARLGGARAQNLLDLGLLDRCAEAVGLAEAEAKKSQDKNALAELRLLAIDRAMWADDHKRAVELARDEALVDPGSPWKPYLLLDEGIAHAELARQERVDGKPSPGQAEAALRCLRAALEDPGLPPGERLKAELTLADLLVTLGELVQAEEHLQLARALVTPMGAGAATQEVLLDVHAWRLALARDVERTELDRADLERAGEALRAAFRRLLDQWGRTPQREGGIGFLQLGERQLVVSEVLGMELELHGAEAAFARLLEAQTLGTAARAREASVPTLAELRAELLAPERGILVLLPARDRSHLFVLDLQAAEEGQAPRPRLTHHELPSRDKLVKLAGDVSSALLDDKVSTGPAALASLSKELLPPDVRARIAPWREAVVVGFDLVQNLPFGVLLDEQGQTYGQRLALATAPSLPRALEDARTRPAPTSATLDLVLVAVPEPPAERKQLQAFPFGTKEQALLIKPFARSLSLIGPDATRTLVLAARARLAGARVVHFFVHGIDEREREQRAALVLAAEEGGEHLLRFEDVRGLKLQGLVILSSCGSGRGPPRVGDDQLVHLGGAFLDAGARCVVLSRFPVTSAATLELMARLHAHLAAGESTAEALRKARAEGSPSEAFRAAAFEVLGSAFEPVFAR
jgi:tetratricopeptide (TPR) repeat protein